MMQDDRWLTSIAETGEECPWDNTPIAYGETVVAVSVVMIVDTAQESRLDLVITDEEEQDLLYPPQFYKEGSWKELDLQIRESCPSHGITNSKYNCSYCGDGILNGEVAICLTKGEIHKSQRCPNGEHNSNTFTELEDGVRLICTSCGARSHDEVIAIWDAPVQQAEECLQGTLHKCWRNGCIASADYCKLARQGNHGS